MSYEGYEQLICRNGHYHIGDCWEIGIGDKAEDNWHCPNCNESLTWINSVDTTSDEGNPIKLEIKTSAGTCTCTVCGNIHAVRPETYHVPENGGHRIYGY